MRVPVKQLEQYADVHGFSNSTFRFASAIIRRSKGYYEDTLVNLHHINEDIAKTRRKGKYVRKTLSLVREKLFQSPSFKVVRQHSSYVFQIKIFPLSEKSENIPKPSQKVTADDVVVEAENSDSETDTESLSEDTGIDHQQLIYANQKARSLGIDFGSRGLKIIAQYSREILDKVLQHYQFAREHNDIPSPTGWIIRNLQQKWYQNFKPIRYLKSIEERYFELQDLLIDAVGSLPRRLDRPLQLSLFPKKKSDTLQK